MKKVPNKSEKPVHPTKIKQAVTKKNIEVAFFPSGDPFSMRGGVKRFTHRTIHHLYKHHSLVLSGVNLSVIYT